MAKQKKKSSLEELREKKEEVVKEFLIKHDFDLQCTEFEFMGHTVCINDDLFISIDDIEYDLEKNVAINYFFDWYYYDLYRQMDGYPHVNYRSYIMGFRHKNRSRLKEFVYRTKRYLNSRMLITKILVQRMFGSNKKMRKEFDKLMEQHHNNPLDKCV